MKRKRNLLVGTSLLALIVACGVGQSVVEDAAQEQQTATMEAGGAGMAPMFEVDPLWPKNLPNHWLMGPTIGVDVDSQDHIWVVHRNTPDNFLGATEIALALDPPQAECCAPAPPVLEFDQEGNLVSSFGGPSETGEYEWPSSNHGITIDHMDNIWIGGNGGTDSHVLKFTRTGQFLMQVGKMGARVTGENEDGRPILERGSNDPGSFGRVAKIGIDPDENEAYFADGYFNRRVAVVDADTGVLKRHWGAYGNVPDDSVDLGRYVAGGEPASQFRGPVHCSELSNDGLVYVCDRSDDRIQVFQKDGTFVNEVVIAPATLSQGSTWDIDFSPDPEQTYIYLADGQNMKVYIIDRETMEVLTAFGDGGRQPGMFYGVHSISVDSSGNIYTTETYEGSRVQKFIYKGIGPIPAGAEGIKSQGVPWPTN